MTLKEYYQAKNNMRPDDFEIPELELSGNEDSNDAYPFVYFDKDYVCQNKYIQEFKITIPANIYFSNAQETHGEVWESMAKLLLKQLDLSNFDDTQLQRIEDSIYSEIKELTQGDLVSDYNYILCGRIWVNSYIVGIWDLEEKSKNTIYNCLTALCNKFGIEFNKLLLQYHVNYEDVVGSWNEFINKSDNEYDYTEARNIHLGNYKDKRDYLSKYLNDVYAHREQKHGLEARYKASLPFRESINLHKIIKESKYINMKTKNININELQSIIKNCVQSVLNEGYFTYGTDGLEYDYDSKLDRNEQPSSYKTDMDYDVISLCEAFNIYEYMNTPLFDKDGNYVCKIADLYIHDAIEYDE